ncbi:protein Gawky isoform X2 [Halyomorpha halys]|uniref:protein Gawky isoform X2 n=1 Tax=Halyomorpha halys TaxID=286706 RepID=UPI0006D4CC29|nr:protein Gawky isoform X2 [Halyomorpha halys]
MFRNNSSSNEISSKTTNAFVQNKDEEDKSESLLRGMAQPPKPISPTLQVPEKRDVMVVDIGVREEDGPVLTVITNHPSQAPAKISSSEIDECESDGSSKMPLAETHGTGALCLDSIKSISVNKSFSVKDKFIYPSKSSILPPNIPKTNDDTDQDVKSFKICDYYTRWGIPRNFKLLGGGESSLTTGTTGWGSPPSNQGGSSGWNSASTTSGNNSSSGQGQAGAGQSPAPASAGQTWGSSQNNTNNSNSSSNNNNGSRNSVSQQGGGSTQQQPGGGPPSQSTAPPVATVSTPTVTTAPASSATNTSNINTATTSSSQQNGSTTGNQVVGSGSTWATAVGKGLPPTSTATTPTSSGSTSTKQQMEQLNTMREALYSQDGWGGQNVNQDSNWDIPGSPEPGTKDSNNAAPVPLWKLPINNGTDLWEANLRNGGVPPPVSQQSQKTPWVHTPSTNIGGTWGEDDEGDASNVWTGVPQAQTGCGPQWPAQPPPIWPATKKEGDWGGPNWNDQRDTRDLRHSSDMRQMMDARDHMRPSIDHRSMGGNDVIMRGDPRGISGRLNGVTSEAMWPGPGPHHHIPHHQGKLPSQPNQPVNQWSSTGPPMKDMTGLGGKSTGWEEPSPPAQRRNMPNYDDGTSLWGPQHPRPTIQGQNKVSHWKEMPTPGIGRGGLQCPPGRANPTMKPEQPLWPHHPRNERGWEGGMDSGPWGDEKPTPTAAPWMDQGLAPSSWQGGPKHKPAWDGSDLDPTSWVHSKQPSKSVSKEFIWTSKQFRILSEMGFKKEDIESALRSSGMSLEDALDQLNTNRGLSGGGGGERWPRHGDLDPEHAAIMNAFPSPQQTICLAPYPGGGGGGSGSGPGGGPTLATITPAVMQKLLAQQPPQQQPFAQQSSRTQQTQQPSAQQLRMLVQQIQMAVQTGYLSPQILNQPLAPQTLILLNQLLQQIKNLQQLMQHHTVMQVNPLGKPSSNHLLQLSVQITKTKQQITNLQNQIAAQQAVYVKHQQHTPPTTEFFKSSLHEPISGLHPNFSDLSLKDPPTSGTSQQSRLNQWKLPALEKDSDIGSGEFSRAPGTTAKSAQGSSSPNTNLLLGQADGTWSSVNRESSWPDSAGDDASGKDWPNSSQPPSQAFSDLVPEFEPGKPWKGNPLKSIEDDPSLTPGSVVRSPLSLPSIKDTHILSTSTGAGKASPTTSSSLDIIPSLGLSSSTWSFNPPPSSSNTSVKLNSSGAGGGGSGSTSNNGGGKNSASTWETNSSELWAPKRGPPPGLPAKPTGGSSGGQATNGWGPLSSSGRWSTGQGWPGPNQAAATQPGSTWLLLRNLTPQIDGSTLKTLCLQHGPLSNFHLYLNHGIALAKYASREEANKAQGALNNCVLGNTTIFAESPSETDVLSLLQHLGGQGSAASGSSAWRGKEAWGNSQLWGATGASSTAASLWAGDSDQHRNTPSSINSYLPGDLLGGESI